MIMRTLVSVLLVGLVLAAPVAAAAQPRQPNGSSARAGFPTPTAGTVLNDYQLGIGDKLRVEVYKDPQLSQSLQVRPDGKITLPLVGDVQAAGLTPLQLR